LKYLLGGGSSFFVWLESLVAVAVRIASTHGRSLFHFCFISFTFLKTDREAAQGTCIPFKEERLGRGAGWRNK